MKFSVYDDDGLLALINSEKYRTFVDGNWRLDQLLKHFVTEMNNQNLIIWQTNNYGGGKWEIEVLDQPTSNPSFQEFSKTIEVTNQELYLTSYADLTMAAQFSDEVLPSKENADLKIPVDNGIYKITVRQMFDPNNYSHEEDEKTSFEMIITKAASNDKSSTKKVFWWAE